MHFKENCFKNGFVTGKGKCGVAVIRVSGPNTGSVLHKIAGLKKLPEPRKALLCRLRHPVNNEILDRALVLWFPGNFFNF